MRRVYFEECKAISSITVQSVQYTCKQNQIFITDIDQLINNKYQNQLNNVSIKTKMNTCIQNKLVFMTDQIFLDFFVFAWC